jgi:hypothetical protein
MGIGGATKNSARCHASLKKAKKKQKRLTKKDGKEGCGQDEGSPSPPPPHPLDASLSSSSSAPLYIGHVTALPATSVKTLFDIVCTALQQHRYTWRHDSVLANLKPALESHIAEFNQKAPPTRSMRTLEPGLPVSAPSEASGDMKVPHISASFVSAGAPRRAGVKTAACSQPTLLDGSRDWKVHVDFEGSLIFPPEIYATDKRPDVLLVSRSQHKVISIELTVPAEEGISNAETRKLARYAPLYAAINDDDSNPWNVEALTIEVGARGFVPKSLPRFLRKIGGSRRKATSLCKDISAVVSKCSFTILNSQKSKHWKKPDYVLAFRDPLEDSDAPSV